MAILGQDGRIQLVREAPNPETLPPSGLRVAERDIAGLGTGFWSGDKVVLFAERGLPTNSTPTGTLQWVGVGPYIAGPTRLHVPNDASAFWVPDDSNAHWENLLPGDPVEATYYIYVDEFDRISFYESLESSLSGNVGDRIPILSVDWGRMEMRADESIIEEWDFVCSLRSWSFETQSNAIDTTPIGVRFGEAVKSIVTGTGDLDFFVDRQDQLWNGIKTMRLAMLVDKGSKAHAHFFLTQDDAGCNGKSIYYEADILIVASSLSVRIDEAIVGTANFATTGPIALKIGPGLH